MSTQIHHVSIFVRDLERSLELFSDILYMEIIQRLERVRGARISKLLGIPDFEADMVFLKHPDQDVCLELVHQTGPSEAAGNPGTPGGVGLSLTVTDLETIHAKLGKAGWVPLSGPLDILDPAGRAVRAFCFHTEEGLVVELIEQAV